MKLLLSIFIILFPVFFYSCSKCDCDSDYNKCESNCQDKYGTSGQQYQDCHDKCWSEKTDCEDGECWDYL